MNFKAGVQISVTWNIKSFVLFFSAVSFSQVLEKDECGLSLNCSRALLFILSIERMEHGSISLCSIPLKLLYVQVIIVGGFISEHWITLWIYGRIWGFYICVFKRENEWTHKWLSWSLAVAPTTLHSVLWLVTTLCSPCHLQVSNFISCVILPGRAVSYLTIDWALTMCQTLFHILYMY